MDLALLNGWQRGFPLEREPFARIGREQGLDAATVLARLHACRADGRLGRIGGVFAAGAGGSGLLAAMAVPADRLEAVAAQVSALPGVNHNYEREHRWNLWFVIGGPRDTAVQRALDGLEADTGLPTLRLPMQRAYRIDLGFDLAGAAAQGPTATRSEAAAPLPEAEWPLAALVERGLPLVARPYDDWAAELGFAANAMTVFDVADAEADAVGARLAREAGVSLAYRRARAPGWPYNLFCMVHGRDRAAVAAVIDGVRERAGLGAVPHAVLFSRRRFKQTGPRRFAAATPEVCDAA